MTRNLGIELPTGSIKYLESRGDSGSGRVVFLLTIDKNGMPHVCLLSPWEVLPKDKRTILLGTYPDSSTTRNIRERRRGTLVLIDKGLTYYIKGNVTPLRNVEKRNVKVAISVLKISDVLEDKEAGGSLETGVTFSEQARAKAESHELTFQELLNASKGDWLPG